MWIGASWCESLELNWGFGVTLAGGRQIRPCPTATESGDPRVANKFEDLLSPGERLGQRMGIKSVIRAKENSFSTEGCTTPSTLRWLWSTKATLNGPTTTPSTRPYTPLTTPRSKEERTGIAPPRVPTHTPTEVAATSLSLASRSLKPHTQSLECLHDGRRDDGRGWGQHSGLFSCSDSADMNRDNRTKQHCP